MALTREQLDKWTEKQIQLEIAAIPGPAVALDLEPELDDAIEAKQSEIDYLYRNHKGMTRAEYAAAVAPLQKELQNLKNENTAIKSRNAVKQAAAPKSNTFEDVAKVSKSKAAFVDTIKATVKADIALIQEKKTV